MGAHERGRRRGPSRPLRWGTRFTRRSATSFGRLPGSATFTVAEFAAGTASIFEISRDEHGTPSAVRWRYTCLRGRRAPGRGGGPLVGGDHRSGEVLPVRCAQVHRAHAAAAAQRPVRPPVRREQPVPVYTCEASLPELLRGAVRESPLAAGYELAVLERVQASQTGPAGASSPGSRCSQLARPEARQVRVRVTCEPTEAEETASPSSPASRAPTFPRRPRSCGRSRSSLPSSPGRLGADRRAGPARRRSVAGTAR